MFGQHIIETPDGLFHSPIHIWRELTLLSLVALVLVLGPSYLGKTIALAWIVWAVALVLVAGRRYRQFKRHGPLGPPSVSLASQTLYIDRPQDSEGGVAVALADLKRVVIYGQSRRRIFHLLRNDQTYVEVVPQWRAVLEHRAIQFLSHALPEKVVVEEPQSLFAAVRAEGPQTRTDGVQRGLELDPGEKVTQGCCFAACVAC